MEKQKTLDSIGIKSIIKRNGQEVNFNINKIAAAIFKAAESVGGKNEQLASSLAQKVILELRKKLPGKTPTVDNVQDLVEKVLIEEGHAKTAKAYILYRYKKKEQRERRELIMGKESSDENLLFSDEALKILERRYLL